MTAASNSEARKRAIEAASNSESAALATNTPNRGDDMSGTANGTQNATQRVRDLIALEVAAAEERDSGAIGRLTEEERESIEAAVERDLNVMHGTGDYWRGYEDVNAVVERILREHTDRALAEVEQRIEAWIRHGEAVPADVTTYDRGIVHEELRAIVRAARQEAAEHVTAACICPTDDYCPRCHPRWHANWIAARQEQGR